MLFIVFLLLLIISLSFLTFTRSFFVQASQELSSWGLSLHPSILETEGRQLPIEKILFQKNIISLNLDADWGRDVVKEHVISAVSSRHGIMHNRMIDQILTVLGYCKLWM